MACSSRQTWVNSCAQELYKHCKIITKDNYVEIDLPFNEIKALRHTDGSTRILKSGVIFMM